MDPNAAFIDKHLTNFKNFACQFTKVFMPIIETATKMSEEEHISAYSVFKVAKDLKDKNKKTKKKENNSAKGKKSHKVTVKKQPISVGCKTISKSKTAKTKKSKSVAIKINANCGNIQSPVSKESRVKQKASNKSRFINKKEIEDCMTVESDRNSSSDGGSKLQDKDTSFDPNTYSAENAINGSGDISLNALFNDGKLSDSIEDFQTAEMLKNAKATKEKKRKSADGKTKFVSGEKNANLDAKKTKISNSKSASRRTLPITDQTPAQDADRRLYSTTSSNERFQKIPTKSASITTPSTNNPLKSSSIVEGKRSFQWLINPVKIDDFFIMYWERKPCLIKRNEPNYYSNLISFKDIDEMFLKNHVEFTKNVDVTSYKNGVRKTLNPEGRALAPAVWDHYGQGCSIRLLNPQTFLPNVYALCSTLQEYFHCMVGANVYLTPPNSQGFAPHYDDIEAFVLQIEGRKRWKIYKPRCNSDKLPRFSSENLNEKEIGELDRQEVLEPGDVLYFPRGTIHQACTEPGYHSLHITLSVYQKQSFADLFEKMLPIMMEKAIASNLDMRKGLPLNGWQHAGRVFRDHSSQERAVFIGKVTELFQQCICDLPIENIIDAAMDQLAKKFQHEALPPHILPCEKLRTVFGSRSFVNESGECVCDYDITERTNVRLLRANILRLVEEMNKIHIYYYLDNSKEYCEYEPNFMEIESREAASIEVLVKSYPAYIGVSEFPLLTTEEKINLATALWERGLLMLEKPFK